VASTFSTFRRVALAAALLLPFAPGPARAGDGQLLYFEAQGIAGYSRDANRLVAYSMEPDAEMQRPSLGFDWLNRFRGESGDVGSAALQFRLAYKRTDPTLVERVEPQVYNAWVKAKTPWADVWVGHNRPALGLGSWFDSHGLILRTLPIQGFGYDRDWGVGLYRDTKWGNVQVTATTGTGMPIRFEGNHLLAARIGFGVVNEDNFTAGLSYGYGRTLDTMGYTVRDPNPADLRLAGFDLALMRNRFEHRLDLLAGEWLGEKTTAAMYRIGYLVDPEGRLKLEAQPTWWRRDGSNWLASACASGLVTPDLTARAMYEYDREARDWRVVAQLYYYKPM
jgi:hypothetical protein